MVLSNLTSAFPKTSLFSECRQTMMITPFAPPNFRKNHLFSSFRKGPQGTSLHTLKPFIWNDPKLPWKSPAIDRAENLVIIGLASKAQTSTNEGRQEMKTTAILWVSLYIHSHVSADPECRKFCSGNAGWNSTQKANFWSPEWPKLHLRFFFITARTLNEYFVSFEYTLSAVITCKWTFTCGKTGIAPILYPYLGDFLSREEFDIFATLPHFAHYRMMAPFSHILSRQSFLDAKSRRSQTRQTHIFCTLQFRLTIGRLVGRNRIRACPRSSPNQTNKHNKTIARMVWTFLWALR